MLSVSAVRTFRGGRALCNFTKCVIRLVFSPKTARLADAATSCSLQAAVIFVVNYNELYAKHSFGLLSILLE